MLAAEIAAWNITEYRSKVFFFFFFCICQKGVEKKLLQILNLKRPQKQADKDQQKPLLSALCKIVLCKRNLI